MFDFELLLVFVKGYGLCFLECFLGFDGESVESNGHCVVSP